MLVSALYERRVNTMRLYAVSLACGHTVLAKSVRGTTIDDCLRDVSKIYVAATGIDPRYFGPKPLGCTNPPIHESIKCIIDEVKRWEGLRKLQEPLTDPMVRWLKRLETSSGAKPDSLLAAIVDWAELGLSVGYRISEFAQPNQYYKINNPQKNKYHEPYAFCMDNFTFQLKDKTRIQGHEVTRYNVSELDILTIRFRAQKNGDDGQQKIYAAPEDPLATYNPPRAAKRIITRFISLFGRKFPAKTPLGIYRNEKGVARFIIARDLEYHFQLAAAAVYNLNKETESGKAALSKWTSKSIRIGATIILYENGYSIPQLQFILRWRSDAYKYYLCNVRKVAKQQAFAMNENTPHPNINNFLQ